MNLTKTNRFFVPHKDYAAVWSLIRENKVKHWPIERTWDGHFFTIEDSPVASYIVLKYS